jgi:SpoVK/Ycf46/Vps4 family AAA+-type ATPase
MSSPALTHAIGQLAGRLAKLLAQLSDSHSQTIDQSRSFLWSSWESVDQGEPLARSERPEPIDHLARRFQFTPIDLEILALAVMADEHEGYSAVLRSLHPKSESRATAGLAAQLLFPGTDGRDHCRKALEQAPVVRSGAVRLTHDAPFFDRSLVPAEDLWAALHGDDIWPAEVSPLASLGATEGLEKWLSGLPALRAIDSLDGRATCTIAVTGDDTTSAFHRAVALVTRAGFRAAPVAAPVLTDRNWLRLLSVHAALRDAVPVLRLPIADGPAAAEDYGTIDFPGPLVIAGTVSPGVLGRGRPLISVPVEPLGFRERRAMWSALVPALADSADQLASRYPLEAWRVAETARDLDLVSTLEHRQPTLADAALSLRSRAHRPLSAGVKLVRPRACWEDLVLPRDTKAQLLEAVDRLTLQSCVLDDWGFLANRTGARGVRVLLAGPPGTGKTLSAEVLARALECDLLVVDVSRVVSKWVGETEKNLSAAFDAAEDSQAVLLFDEADALFSKRTEVADAHDRYANLETAYLLQRLERFEGLAILATNLRQNIDAAFVRRLEFVVEYTEPDREQRGRLWRCHVPADAPVDRELNYNELAALYPVVGGVIRNAAAAAAFRAAADGMPLCREHFIHAIRREYEKAGKAFPGLPAGMRN